MEREFKGLSKSFNVAVFLMAELCCPTGYDIQADAPTTLKSLTAHIQRTGRIAVHAGHSDRTIFDDLEANYAFCAWHDWTHWKLQAEFSDTGEQNVYHEQLRHLKIHGLWSPEHEKLLHAEVTGQLCHFNKWGHFPDDQIGFVASFVQDPSLALGRPW